MACGKISRNKRKICISYYDKKIIIQKPTYTPSNAPNTNATAGFSNIKEVWAFVKSVNPFSPQNSTNNNLQTITTEFYVRYDSSIIIDDTLYIEYNSEKYRVTQIDNIDLKNETLVFRAIKRGDEAKLANLR